MRHPLVFLSLFVLFLAACAGLPILTRLTGSGSTPSPLPSVPPAATVTPSKVPSPSPTPTRPLANLPPALRAAIQALSASMGVNITQVKSVNIQAAYWPDACLGVSQPGKVCAQVVTPGWSYVLEVKGRQVTYHTNADGSVVVPATLLLTWHREGGIAGFCDDLLVYQSYEVRFSSCKTEGALAQGSSLAKLLSKEQQAQLEQWLNTYRTVKITVKDAAVADAMTTQLTFYGLGSSQPDEASKQALLDLVSNLAILVARQGNSQP